MKVRQINLGLCVCVLSAAGLLVVPQAKAETQSTFDSGTEGWTLAGDGTLSFSATRGDPPGSLQAVDAAFGADLTLIAPGKFLGDLTASDGVDTLGFEGLVDNTSSGSLYDGYGLVTITGNGLTASQDIASTVPIGTGATFSTPLTAAAWGMSQSDWTTLLSNVTQISVVIEGINGGETDYFDNFHSGTPARVATVPLPPAALTIPLGLALMGVFYRRHRRPCAV